MADAIETALADKKLEDLVVEKVDKSNGTPKLTITVVDQAIELLKEVEKNGGYGDIAKTIGFAKINKLQVKQIHKAMQVKINELTPEIDPVTGEPITK